ncbi:hypothetical protein VTK56DRAFT_10159 [Thermocarpiscus australiensis]
MAQESHLLNLPVGILFIIFSELIQLHHKPYKYPDWHPPLPNYPALENLALSCRDLRHVAFPFIYQRVSIATHESTDIVRLVRHFALNPQLALLVRELEIKNRADVRPEWRHITLGPTDTTFVLEQANRLGLKLPDEPNPTSLDAPSQSSMLVDLILSRVSDVRKVKITQWPVAYTLYYGRLLPDSLVFRSLQHLEVGSMQSGGEYSMGTTALQLDSLAALLRHAPAVRVFRLGYLLYDHVLPRDAQKPLPPGRQRTIAVGRVLKDLAHLRSTLRDLHIGWHRLRAPTIGTFSLLRHFEELRSLTLLVGRWPVADSHLFAAMLPPRLKSLALVGGNMPVVTIALGLRERVDAGGLPKLKTLEFNVHWQEMDAGTAERIAKALEGTGIAWHRRFVSQIQNITSSGWP